ncbi:hypothetical protein, partial [Caballeronia sp. M23-90]
LAESIIEAPRAIQIAASTDYALPCKASSTVMLPLRPHRFERDGAIAVRLQPHLDLLPFLYMTRVKRIDHF